MFLRGNEGGMAGKFGVGMRDGHDRRLRPGGRDWGRGWALGRVVPACAGMTERGAGMTERGCGNDGGGGARMTREGWRGNDGEGVAWAIGGRLDRRLRLADSHPPPHLPPGRGRDELGEGRMLEWVPACAGMTGGDAGNDEMRCGNDGEGVARTIGGGSAGGCGLRTPTPHLTSPLEGGRDELGEAVGVGVGGSCLRRNDGEGGAGMTREGVRE